MIVDDVEQTPLIGVTSDPASEQPGLTSAADIGGGETAGSDRKHGQIGLTIADGDRLGIRSQDPVAKRRQAGPFIGLPGYDSCVDDGMMESKEIQSQVHEQLVYDVS